ncbi:17-beta-hydroxysteroid dehydrogenase type 6 [Trichonephila clavipes]|nr:17-beta-hydroxysteroid dehydrogenase type 6 [Trichonephila clavipes]
MTLKTRSVEALMHVCRGSEPFCKRSVEVWKGYFSSDVDLVILRPPPIVLEMFQSATLVDNTLPRFRVSSSNKAVFVTGCDKGFGRLLAIRLDSLGYKVFAGCLEPEGKETQKLKEVVSNNLEIIPLDVTQVDSVQNALETVESKLGCYGLNMPPKIANVALKYKEILRIILSTNSVKSKNVAKCHNLQGKKVV